MNIGIIGAGEMGMCLATKFVKLGHVVSLANARGPATLAENASDIGAEATTVEGAMNDKDVIVVSIPLKNIPDLPIPLFENLSDEVVVIDTCNYYPGLRDGVIQELDDYGIDSLWVQEKLGARITKVFNSILATSLQNHGRTKGEPGRIALAVSGDSKTAKTVVCNLVDELGFDSLDLGDLGQSWKQQPGSAIYCRDLDLDKLRKRVDTMGTSWADMHDMIIGKRRDDEVLMRDDYSKYLSRLV